MRSRLFRLYDIRGLVGFEAWLYRRMMIPVDWFYLVAIGFCVSGVCVKGFLTWPYVCVRICFCRGEVRDSNRTGDICHLPFVGARGYFAWLVELWGQLHRWDVIPVD